MNKNLQLIFNLISNNKIHEANDLIENYKFTLDELNEVNFLKGVINLNQKKYSKSINFFKKNINSKKLQIDSVNNICLILQKKNKKKILSKLINLLLSFKPKNNYIFFNIAIIYDFLGDFDKSLKIINEIKDANAEVIAFQASIFRKKNLITEALKIINNYKKDKGSYYLLKEKASCLAYVEKFDEALKIVNTLIQKYPEDKSLLFSKSTYLLALEKYKSAVKLFDYRFEKNQSKEKFPLKKKLWNGEKNNKILIWSEDGLGDHILYLKLVEFVSNVNEKHLIIDKRLHHLYKNYLLKKKITNIHIVNQKINLNNYDSHIPAGSLMKFIDFNNLKKISYLQPKKKMVLNDNFINIGIAWKTLNKDQSFRSLPFAKIINLLSNFSNIKIYNLQFGDIEDEKKFCRENNINLNICNNIDYTNDINRVASLISGLDFVISSQNTVAHLSSAIGKKVLLLLPIGHRWYWNFNKKDKLDKWYKNTFVFKQNTINSWEETLDELKNELSEISKNPSFYRI